MSLQHETLAFSEGYSRIAGVDEAGRGPLAGPVVAAACILPRGKLFAGVDDSKKLTPKQRERLFETLTTDPEVSYGVSLVEAETIDQINILQATFLAMVQAVQNLSLQPDYLLIDGNQLPPFSIPAKAIIDGDALSHSIAAASIIAKVTRDRLMLEASLRYPLYGFDKHKGYGTKSHLLAIEELGPCALHRLSFEPLKSRRKGP